MVKVNFIDFRKRKSVHIALHTDTHKNFRKVLLDKDLSMQEVFQKFSELAVMGDKRAIKILEEAVNEKRLGLSKRSSSVIDVSNLDTIYSLIEGSQSEEEDEDEQL